MAVGCFVGEISALSLSALRWLRRARAREARGQPARIVRTVKP